MSYHDVVSIRKIYQIVTRIEKRTHTDMYTYTRKCTCTTLLAVPFERIMTLALIVRSLSKGIYVDVDTSIHNISMALVSLQIAP